MTKGEIWGWIILSPDFPTIVGGSRDFSEVRAPRNLPREEGGGGGRTLGLGEVQDKLRLRNSETAGKRGPHQVFP